MGELLLLPPTLSSTEFIVLISVSCLTSFISASVGIGGGTVLLAVMAQILPIKALIPVHGVVQFGSNVGRAALLYKHIQPPHVLWFIAGSVVGVAIGGNLVMALPTGYLKFLLGCFILFSVWGSIPEPHTQQTKVLSVGGAVSSFLTMFVGATGPFVMATLRPFGFQPAQLVATNATCMAAQHALKIIVFGVLGFAFSNYLLTISLMICAGFIGTLCGRHILFTVHEVNFRKALNIVLTLLALRLLYSGISIVFSN